MALPVLPAGAPCSVRVFCAVLATIAGPRPSLAIAIERSRCRCYAASRAFFLVDVPAAAGASGAPCSVEFGPSAGLST